MKVLFIVPYPTEGASNRYRVEQYLPILRKEGIECTVRPFVSPEFFKILYQKHRRIEKVFHFLSASVKRFLDITRAAEYDLIFVHLEAFPFGPAVLEHIFSKFKKGIIYDFEDAVYLPNFRSGNRFIRYLRYPQKFYHILNLSSHVIVCNKYMEKLVRTYNNNVSIVPTSIDMDRFTLRDFGPDSAKPTIGWIGSHTTLHYLKGLAGVFSSLARKYEFSLRIIGGGENFDIPGVNVINEDWSLEREVENFQKLDIGIYPLPNDERSRAKTPFKTIQYMSVGASSVVSRVGGNRDIIRDGVNGFLASDENEWFEKLSALIENPGLRKDFALKGRKTVERQYSLKASAPKLVDILKKAYHGKPS